MSQPDSELDTDPIVVALQIIMARYPDASAAGIESLLDIFRSGMMSRDDEGKRLESQLAYANQMRGELWDENKRLRAVLGNVKHLAERLGKVGLNFLAHTKLGDEIDQMLALKVTGAE